MRIMNRAHTHFLCWPHILSNSSTMVHVQSVRFDHIPQTEDTQKDHFQETSTVVTFWNSSYQTCSRFRWQDVRFLLRNAQSVEHRVNIKTKSEASWNRPLTSKCSVATLWLAVAIASFLINERAKTKTRVFTKPSAFTSCRLKG